MKLSNFHIKLIWLIGIILFILLMFSSSVENLANEIIGNFSIAVLTPFRIFPFFALLIWIMDLNENLEEMLSLKYRLTDKGYGIDCHYLTLCWCITPCWKPIETESHSFEMQNIFGATSDTYYSTDVSFDNKEKGKFAIQEHKRKLKQNRKDFFKRNEPEKKNVTYF